MKIDLILLTYKPQKTYVELLEKISLQDTPVNMIYVVNVEQKYYDRLSYNEKSLVEYKNIKVRHMSRREVDAGKTKNQLVEMSDADYFLVMNQDAVPVATDLITKLMNSFKNDEKVAVSYARHISEESSPEYLKYIKKYYYSDTSVTRSERDLANYGRMTYFMSNVCAMYKRSAFEDLGGFDNHVIINEDILFAYRAINSGYKVAYVADAEVVIKNESEVFDFAKHFFDYGVVSTMYPEVFSYTEIIEEGKKIIKMTKNHLLRNGYRSESFSFSKFASKMMASYKKGRKYRFLSKDRILKLSANKGFWNTDDILKARGGVNARLGYGRSEEETNMLKTPPVNRHKWDEKED